MEYVNDADYVTQPIIDGKRVVCPYFKVWKGMWNRCTSSAVLKDRPNYEGKKIYEGWIYFTAFKSWMMSQVWDGGLHLDKDILDPEANTYSPTTCAFVPGYINTLLNTRYNDRGIYPLGVTKAQDKRMVNPLRSPYVATACSRYKTNRYLGIFSTPEEVHKAWQKAKVEAIESSIVEYRKENCYRVDIESALKSRVEKLKNDIKNNLETKQL